MNGERNTPIGTPVVIAPGKIPLIGEYAILEDGDAVFAAISRHAKAQFVPRIDTMSSMVSVVVKLAKAELGDVSAALPPGSVQVNTDDFQQGSERDGFGASAATAIAAVGALFESLGLAIADQKTQILAIADAARRAAQKNPNSGADLTTATYGGLTRIIRLKNTAVRIESLTSPVGLHLVLFSVSQSIATAEVLEGVQQYAKHQPAAFGRSIDELREIARRFVDDIVSGNATGAVVAAGRYGEQLAKLAAEASVPILTGAFVHASELARAMGGIAKPIGAGGGTVGVAMFATPEAARLFRRACSQLVTPLDGDLDCLGVRCQGEQSYEEPEAVALYQSSTPAGTHEAIAGDEQAEVRCPAENADTAPVSATETSREVAAPNAEPTDEVVSAASEDMTSLPTMEVDETTPEESPRAAGVGRRTGKRIVRGAVALLALIVVAWLIASNPLRARARADRTPPPPLNDGVGLANVAPPSPPEASPPRAAPPAAEVDQPPVEDPAPAPQNDGVPARRRPPRLAAKHAHKPAADKTVSPSDADPPKRSPPAAHVPGRAATSRAGDLSPDDF